MRSIVKIIVAGMLSCALAGGAASAAEFDPTGSWQTVSGSSHYDLAYCGGDGGKLCATLSWLDAKGMASSAKNDLGQYAIKEAAHSGPNVWKGPMKFQGHDVDATLTFTGPMAVTIAGCYFVLCKSFELVKISK
ncbi:MAG: hypothetical protein JWN11_578 [Hyphomicrobiales bacterium]|nr:hypothetical protein [Hyphomicrobiales bacterium]